MEKNNTHKSGKMRLEYQRTRKSAFMAFALAMGFGMGLHHFYLRQWLWGGALIIMGVFAVADFAVAEQNDSPWQMVFYLYGLWYLIEIFLVPVATSLANARIQRDLNAKYGLSDIL